jgi:RNA polymerase sigma-70 factor (ECF subfamily)
LTNALAEIPYEQREVIMLHLKGGLKFRQIARVQQTSVSTVHGRYRYGLKKLRTILDGKLEK